MNCKKMSMQSSHPVAIVTALLVFIASVLLAPSALALTVTVQGVDNTVTPAAESSLSGYRWLIEEDKTYHVPLTAGGEVELDGSGAPVIDPNWRVGPDGVVGTADDDPLRNTLSVSFHHSYMPVVATGTEGVDTLPPACSNPATDPDPCLDPTKNYYISVLPSDGYSIGGAQINAGQAAVTVYVNKHPIPTTQITVFVHEDIAPINNVWDQGENGLEGFTVILEDAGGKYGASAGIQSLDAFGNPLCTTYQYVDANGDGQHNPGEPFVPDATTGEPIVDVPGAGCTTGPDGMVNIRNIAPGKYGVMTVPPNAVENPPGSGNFQSTNWIQTSTIEGKKVIDAWVKANEPAFFGEFGPPGPHVSIGYVPAGPANPYVDETVLTGSATIEGQVVNLHLSRPPDTAFHNGGPHPHTTPWVGLNLGAAGLGRGVYAARANDDGTFFIPNVPPGSYQLVVWDDNLDLLFAKRTVVVNADPTTGAFDGTCNALNSCNLGEVPVFEWFARMEHYVFNDENENGLWDAGEQPMLEQNVNLRWRDGTIYQAFPTDGDGVAPFDEVFPFFAWLVAEVDFARFKATGATVVVDDGGAIPFGDPWAFDDVLNPQPQGNPADPACVDPLVCTETTSYRTELGPVLTEGFQAFLGQTNVVQWGKKAYGPGENGGISGMVLYAVTRAEDDPAQAAAEPWEPGIANVTVNLYASDGTTLLATTTTDSWDDSLPSNCQYGANAGSGTDDPFVFRGIPTDCYDGMRNWNQVRPGVFDGGYAFDAICPGGLETDGTCAVAETSPIPPAIYIVEVVPPRGYKVIKSHDRNVDFGDTYFPSMALLAAPCVGADYIVDAELSLFPGEPAPLAGQTLKTCDRKQIFLSNGANAAADFFLFTDVPIAGHFIGFILDDTANEFDPQSPQFGEKYAPPFLPVSIRDWTGREIGRTVADEYGRYNALVPSTFTENLGQPSGISPNMLTTCMNGKYRADGSPDPLHNPQYSQFCYTFQYMPGSTTYLDTPVVPVSAFAGADQNPLDCSFVDQTPRIHSVSVDGNTVGGGPYIRARGNNSLQRVRGTQTMTINAVGTTLVPNPAYTGVGGVEPKTIARDYGFGSVVGEVTLGDQVLTVSSWENDSITVSLPNGTQIPGPVGARQLTVTRGDSGASTITGVSVQVGLRTGSSVIQVSEGPGAIQNAIDSAGANDLILVGPGTYNEIVIMWKPVQLQGWGEGSVTIDAVKTPFEKLAAWRSLAQSLLNGNLIDLIPGQTLGFGGIEPATFFSEEGAGVFVVAKNDGGNRFRRFRNRGARIDGITISGADTGGGVVVNGHADYLDVSNLRIVNNSAFFAGGIRVGHPMLTTVIDDNLVYSDADNDNIRVHHNTVTQNGGLDGAGGGIGIHTGTDRYQVTDNFVCGNFTTADGAGIAHFGESNNGLIEGNTVLFNENFNQGITVNGGGILVSGAPGFTCPIDPVTGLPDPVCAVNPTVTLTQGSGSVDIIGNLIQGNSAGVGDGAGIRLSRINGRDVRFRTNGQVRAVGHKINIVNNMIVDNVAALAGGGISMQDALAVTIKHNTIANNDNTSTSGDAFSTGIPSQSNPQPGAGIVSRGHSAELSAFMPANNTFSNATMVNNIVWHNRMFSWLLDDSIVPVITGLCPDLGGLGLSCTGATSGTTAVYDDIAVIGATGPTSSFTCTDCILTGAADPMFVAEYVNAGRQTVTIIPEGTIQAPAALDEGGNFIRLRYGPLTQIDVDTGDLLGNYHIQAGSSALDAGSDAGVLDDFDGEPRPGNIDFDIGADEVQP